MLAVEAGVVLHLLQQAQAGLVVGHQELLMTQHLPQQLLT
jgi:hypothetical protein